jgi:hypothetical protein
MIYEEICIKHSERVSAAFVIQHEMRMRRIIWSCDLSDYHILTH